MPFKNDEHVMWENVDFDEPQFVVIVERLNPNKDYGGFVDPSADYVVGPADCWNCRPGPCSHQMCLGAPASELRPLTPEEQQEWGAYAIAPKPVTVRPEPYEPPEPPLEPGERLVVIDRGPYLGLRGVFLQEYGGGNSRYPSYALVQFDGWKHPKHLFRNSIRRLDVLEALSEA